MMYQMGTALAGKVVPTQPTMGTALAGKVGPTQPTMGAASARFLVMAHL